MVPKNGDDLNAEISFLRHEDAVISPITIELQNEKCQQLNLEFSEPIEQHHILRGEPLANYQPYQTCKIVGDGNCYFRCISKMITGSELNYNQLRNELCRYMVSQGQAKIRGYFHMRNESAFQHIEKTGMLYNTTYSTEAEIMVTSAMLDTDIYVGSMIWRDNAFESEMSWQRFSTNKNNSKKSALYIQNYSEHYEPVIRMMNSPYPTYNRDDYKAIEIE